MTVSLPWSSRWQRGRLRAWLKRRARRGARIGAGAQARFGGHDDRDADWVTVYTAGGLEEAYVIRGALTAEGIPAVVSNQALTHIFGSAMVWGIEVRVPETLVDRALQILDEHA